MQRSCSVTALTPSAPNLPPKDPPNRTESTPPRDTSPSKPHGRFRRRKTPTQCRLGGREPCCRSAAGARGHGGAMGERYQRVRRRHAGPTSLHGCRDMLDSSVFEQKERLLTKLRPFYQTVFCTKVCVSVQPRLQVWVQYKVAGYELPATVQM